MKIAGFGVGLVTLLTLAGCTSGDSPETTGAWQTISPTTSATPTTTAPTTSSPSTTPAGTVPVSVSVKVQALAAQLRTLREQSTSKDATQSMATGLASARASIKQLRLTAYGTGKSCTAASGHLIATRAAASQVSRAAASVDAVNASRRTQMGKVTVAIAGVEAEVKRQKLTVAGLPTIASALQDARDNVASAAKQATDSGAVAASGRAAGAKLASTAADIYYGAC